MTATIPSPALQCDGAISDAILQAARAALPRNPGQWVALPAGAKNEPLVPLLVGLLDATRATAGAVSDNAHDDARPLPRQFALELARQAEQIAVALRSAADAGDLTGGWGLPSMSGKELV